MEEYSVVAPGRYIMFNLERSNKPREKSEAYVCLQNISGSCAFLVYLSLKLENK